jgi:hypothetical protein
MESEGVRIMDDDDTRMDFTAASLRDYTTLRVI